MSAVARRGIAAAGFESESCSVRCADRFLRRRRWKPTERWRYVSRGHGERPVSKVRKRTSGGCYVQSIVALSEEPTNFVSSRLLVLLIVGGREPTSWSRNVAALVNVTNARLSSKTAF